jgi:hypothetical protein
MRRFIYAGRRGGVHVTRTKVIVIFFYSVLVNNASEGHKSSIHTHLNYLVIVSPPFVPTASAASATVRNFVARTPNPRETDITKVVVFEPENKYVAYSGTFAHDVREIISQWGQIYVLTGDGNVCQYSPSHLYAQFFHYPSFSCYVYKKSRHRKSSTCCIVNPSMGWH